MDIILADICPFSLGTELYDGTFSPIIERNDTLPCSRMRYYVTVDDDQDKMNFRIYQGENMMAKDNLLLGNLEITDLPPARAGETGAAVTFLYDINGILDIRIDSENQSVHKVIMNKNMGLSEAELEERLQKLQKMTIHPLGKERDRLLIERAKRLYAESNFRTREQLTVLIRHFKETLAYGKGRQVREEYARISLYLEALERDKLQFKAFDENFWTEQEEEKED